MARYKLVFQVEAARIDALQKLVKQVFPNSVPLVLRDPAASSRSDRLDEIASGVEDAKSGVEELRDELQEWLDGMPENLQQGSKADELNEAIQALEQIMDELDNVDFSSVSFPSAF